MKYSHLCRIILIKISIVYVIDNKNSAKKTYELT